ncbi:EamA family transporter [Paracidovorax avenae]|uniref:DMT family transporter n=1 Tax=Paracidovorax avenae TaxID=80867 RepID=UPI000D20D932|nr:DMT family transporter [Paracidovorax avenae]AVS84632.1 EamA family transporter [Paracidovorax avenae]
MNPRTAGMMQMTKAMVIAGTVGWCVLLTGMPAASVVFWRCAFGALALALICIGRHRASLRGIGLRQAGMAALGGVALAASWALLFAAYSHASIAIATITYHTQPFMLAALGALFFGERMTPSQGGWLGLAFVGLVLIVIGATTSGVPPSAYLSGFGLALAAAFFYALAAAVTKRLRDVPARLIVLIQLIVGSVLLLPFATLPTGTSAPATWALLAAIGGIHTGLMSTLLYSAIQKLPTSTVGVLSFIYPIVAILVDAWAFGHWLGPVQIGGAVAILWAVAGTHFGWRIGSLLR